MESLNELASHQSQMKDLILPDKVEKQNFMEDFYKIIEFPTDTESNKKKSVVKDTFQAFKQKEKKQIVQSMKEKT